MAKQELCLIAPLESPLPPLATGEVLTESQWTTLMAIGDTIIPSIATSSIPSTAKLSVQESEYTAAIDRLNGLSAKPQADLYRKFLEENASSIPSVREAIQRLLSDYMPKDARKGFRVVLSALE